MGLFSKLLGSDSVIEAGISGIDKVWETGEEKTDAKLNFIKLYEPFKVAQRLLAMIVVPPYMLCWLITFLCSFIEGFDISKQEALLDGKIGTAVGVILAFYFGGGLFESVFKHKETAQKYTGKKG